LEAGDPADPDPQLLHTIVQTIADCCGHNRLKCFRLAHGWTVDQAVAHVHRLCTDQQLPAVSLTRRSWTDWENSAGVSPHYQDLLCRLFHTGPVQLGFATDYTPHPSASLAETADASLSPQGSDGPGTRLTVGPTISSSDGDEQVRRDKFLRLAAGALAAPLIHSWPGGNDGRTAAITDDLLAQARAQTEGLRWLDRREGSFQHLPATADFARTLTSYWHTAADNPRRCDLARIAADACHLVAYQAFDQGLRVQAADWYRCSGQLASTAGDLDLYVFALCGVAYMHAKNNEPDLATGVLHQLSRLPLSAAGRCYVASYQAHAHTAAGQLTPALRALDTAAAAADETRNEPPSSWLGVADRAFVDRQRAIILAHFGVVDAFDILDHLRATTPAAFYRFRVTLAADTALTCAHLREPERAAQMLTAALVDNQRTRSAEKARKILAVRALLGSYCDAPSVTALDDVIRHTTANHTPMIARRPARAQQAPS
jgi:hypothetical protein